MATEHDTRFLQELVGDALANGCAAVVTAQPNDPVEFLGQYLLRYVKNADIEGQFVQEKAAKLEARKAELEAAAEAAAKVKEQQEARRAAIIELAKSRDEPRKLLEKAVGLITKYTTAGAAYAAWVAEQEEPDWTYPEDPEDPAAAESDDEPDPNPPAADTEQQAESTEEEQPPVTTSASITQRPIDYSKRYLSYTAASAGQEFLLTTELYRPAPADPDDAEAPPNPPAYTFRILDERRPMIYTANVAFEQAVRFFRNFPKIGAYQACGVQSPTSGEFKAVIAADTLFPEGGGQPLSQDDQDFIWHVSRALSQAYDAVEQHTAAAVTEAAGPGSSVPKAQLESLQTAIQVIYHPSTQAQEEAGKDGAAPPSSSSTPVPPEPAAEVAAEGLGEEEGAADDPVVMLQAEVKALEIQQQEAEGAREVAAGVLDKASRALGVVNDTVRGAGTSAAPALRHVRLVPQATFHALKAVLHVLGKEAATFSNWKRAYNYFTGALFNEMAAYDATQERDLDAWKRARCCYKALGEEGTARMQAEMPSTHLGVLLMVWLKQVRKVARKAAALRACASTCETLKTQLEAKRAELSAAEIKRAEEQEAARKAAEEAAAAEAAAAAAAGEGVEGEAEGEQEEAEE